MPPRIDDQLRPRLTDLIEGTPQQGWTEQLDPNYKMRTGSEAHQFFKRGRVFSMLWAESASETAARQTAPNGDWTIGEFRPGYSQGRFGEVVYSNIRRFVIMKVKRKHHFVYAW
jgi:hypothetical protein